MSTSSRRPNVHRRFSKDFKRARVNDFESGNYTVAQMSRLYKITRATLYTWIKKHSTLPAQNAIIMEIPDSQTAKVKALEERVALLERALGVKQVELDLANTTLDLLAEDGVDIKKKRSSGELSSVCVKTPSK